MQSLFFCEMFYTFKEIKMLNTHIFPHLRTKIYKNNEKLSLLKQTGFLNWGCFPFQTVWVASLSNCQRLKTCFKLGNVNKNKCILDPILWFHSIFSCIRGDLFPNIRYIRNFYLVKMFHHYFEKWSFSVQEWNLNANYFRYIFDQPVLKSDCLDRI